MSQHPKQDRKKLSTVGSVAVATVIACNEGALVLFEHLAGIANLKGKKQKTGQQSQKKTNS